MPILASTKSTYVPPSLRNKPISAAPTSTKKRELKKEFVIDKAAFPSLGDTIKKTKSSGTPISFSSAAAKKVEAPKEVQIDVLPGWVHIRRHNGKIQYKYGKPVERIDNEERAEEIRSRIILKNRIEREEYDRARDIECLGDLSEFYGQPTLAEIYENALEITSDDDNSDYLESDNYE
jgi:hypothetical protein